MVHFNFKMDNVTLRHLKLTAQSNFRKMKQHFYLNT